MCSPRPREHKSWRRVNSTFLSTLHRWRIFYRYCMWGIRLAFHRGDRPHGAENTPLFLFWGVGFYKEHECLSPLSAGSLLRRSILCVFAPFVLSRERNPRLWCFVIDAEDKAPSPLARSLLSFAPTCGRDTQTAAVLFSLLACGVRGFVAPPPTVPAGGFSAGGARARLEHGQDGWMPRGGGSAQTR